jgi:hypothetical protein
MVPDRVKQLFIIGNDIVPEPPYPPKEAKEVCDGCPVRPECLEWALENDEEGVWGGTSSYQRQQLRRTIDRKKCPGCSCTDLVLENKVELCLGCGLSWLII